MCGAENVYLVKIETLLVGYPGIAEYALLRGT